MRKHIGRVAVLAATVALAAAGTSHAITGPDLGVAPDGTAHAVWSHNDDGFPLGQVNSRTAEGLVGEGEFFTPAGRTTTGHSVAVGADGTAVLAWVSADPGGPTVKLRERTAGGGLGPVQTVSAPGAYDRPRLAVDADGDAVVAWLRFVDQKTVVEIRRRAADGALSSVKRLSASTPTYSTMDPALAVDPAGNAYVAWTVLAPNAFIQVRRRAADGTLSARQSVTVSDAPAIEPRIGVDASGAAVIAWRRGQPDGTVRLQTRRRSADGTLGTAVNVSPPASGVVNHQVAVAPGGSALFTWQRQVGPNGIHVETRRRAPGGSLGPIETASAEDETAYQPRVAVDGDGDFVVAWLRAGGAGAYPQARRRSAGGAWSTATDLAPSTSAAIDLRIAVEPGGAAAFAWLDTQSANAVKARRQTAAGELSVIDTLSY